MARSWRSRGGDAPRGSGPACRRDRGPVRDIRRARSAAQFPAAAPFHRAGWPTHSIPAMSVDPPCRQTGANSTANQASADGRNALAEGELGTVLELEALGFAGIQFQYEAGRLVAGV